MKTRFWCSLAVASLLPLNSVQAHPSTAAPTSHPKSAPSAKHAVAQPKAGAGKVEGGAIKHETPAVTKLDAEVESVMHKVSNFYSGLQSISATINSDMLIESAVENIKSNSKSTFNLKAERPNKISLDSKGEHAGGIAKSDGKKLYLFSPQLGHTGACVTADAPDDLTTIFAKPEFAFISGGMSGLALVEPLLAPDPYAALMTGVTVAKQMGKEQVDGVETQHLHFAQRELSWDIWVDTGKEPWVRKVVPDVAPILASYQNAAKDMRMKLVITYKNLAANPKLVAADFAYTAPAQAKAVKSFFGSPEEAKEGADALLRKPAPAISLDTIDGGKFDLASSKGKDIVVIDFWATWCPPCVQSLPLLAELAKEYEGKGVKVYAINVKEESDKIKKFLTEKKLKLNVALDKEGDAARAYNVMGIPQTVVIDTNGVIRDVRLGFDANLKERLAAQFEIIHASAEPAAATK